MCGIAGQVGRDPGPSRHTMGRTAPCSRHWHGVGRTSAVCISAAGQRSFTRGWQVVDLENGLQPMQMDWKGETYVLVYNGELYNTSELRAALANRGHRFTGHSDTEVLLHAFAEWGADCVERCNGIFAFAVWQVNAGTLFLARDRCGVKPLFYYPGRGTA